MHEWALPMNDFGLRLIIADVSEFVACKSMRKKLEFTFW